MLISFSLVLKMFESTDNIFVKGHFYERHETHVMIYNLFQDHDRAAGRLVVLSGATGKPLGKHYLEMPYNKETYMSPVMFTPTDGGATYILFGSGGETIPGTEMVVIMSYVFM